MLVNRGKGLHVQRHNARPRLLGSERGRMLSDCTGVDECEVVCDTDDDTCKFEERCRGQKTLVTDS